MDAGFGTDFHKHLQVIGALRAASQVPQPPGERRVTLVFASQPLAGLAERDGGRGHITLCGIAPTGPFSILERILSCSQGSVIHLMGISELLHQRNTDSRV